MTLPCQDPADIGNCFGMQNAPCLKTVPLKSAVFTVTRIDRIVSPGEVAKVALPCADAYFMMLYLEDTAHSDIQEDGSWTPARRYKRGTVCLVDMECGPSIVLHSSLCSLAFVLPRPLFAEVSELSTNQALTAPRCRRGERDPVISSLGVSLMSLIEGEGPSTSAVLRHLAVAICAHLLYSLSEEPIELAEFRAEGSEEAGAPWRENAAKAFMQANLAHDIGIADIAAVVGLSPNYFSHSFRKATGLTPHQWLMSIRIQHAKDLLKNSSLSAKAIARQCGFFDHSHFTKSFAKHTGLTPQAWRSARMQ